MSRIANWRTGRRRETELIVLGAMDGDGWHYVYDVKRRARIRWGRVYPTLWRLEERGEVEAKWDDSEQPPPKHRRRMYRIATQEDER